MTPPQPPTDSPRRRRRTLRNVTLVIIALLCVAGSWAVVQWRRVPEYWAAHEQVAPDPVLAAVAADELESRVLREVSQSGREADITTITIRYDQANAWLKMNLRQWAAHQQVTIPSSLRDIVVAQEGGIPVVGVAIKTDEIDQVFSLSLNLRMLESGQARVQVARVRAGRLPVPLVGIFGHLRKSIPAEVLEPVEQFVAGTPFDPVMPHPGHEAKRLRLVRFEVTDDAVVLTFRAEAR